MNTGKKQKRSCRRKVVPFHFQKRGHVPLTQMLTTASYQRRIRELTINNRALASTLEDAQCIASLNDMKHQKYARDSNQILLARMKVKDMAVTIQKLVGDLNNVLECLDSCSLTSYQHHSNNDVRIRIKEPELDTIDESMQSVGSNTVTKELNGSQNIEDTTIDVIATESRTPSTPQLNLSSCINTSELLTKIKPQGLENSDSVKGTKYSLHVSKIPVRRQNLFIESFNHIGLPVNFNDEKRRETFVVTKFCNDDQNNCMPVSDRRGTFVLSGTINDLPSENESNFERQGTFLIPTLTPPPPPTFLKPDLKLYPTSIPQHVSSQIYSDEKTVFLGADMTLTEIIPPATVPTVTATLLNKDKYLPSENLFQCPVDITDKHKPNNIPTNIKINEPLSSICNTKVISQIVSNKVKEGFESLTKQHESQEIIDVSSDEIGILDTSQVLRKEITGGSFCAKSVLTCLATGHRRSSRQKSLHPDNIIPENINVNQNFNAAFKKNKNSETNGTNPPSSPKKDSAFNAFSPTSEKTETIVKNVSNTLPIKPILSKISGETELTNLHDPISPDPEFIYNIQNLKEPFKSCIKAINSSECATANVHSQDIKEKVDYFSSPDSEDETSKKSKPNKSKKDSSKSEEAHANISLDLNKNLPSAKASCSLISLEKNQLHENCCLGNSILKKCSSPSEQSSLSCDKSIIPLEDIQINKLNSELSKNMARSSANKHINKLSETSIGSFKELLIGGNGSFTENGSKDNSKHIEKSETMLKKETICFDCIEIKKGSEFQPKISGKERGQPDIKEVDLYDLEVVQKKGSKCENERGKPCILNSIADEIIKDTIVESRDETSSCNSSFFIALPNKTGDNFDDQTEKETTSSRRSKKSSYKYSDLFGLGNKNSKESKSKRTFSGVSERGSKKKVASTNDFLEDLNINILPPDIHLSGNFPLKDVNKAEKHGTINIAKPDEDLDVDDPLVISALPVKSDNIMEMNGQKLLPNSKAKKKKNARKVKRKTEKSSTDFNILQELQETHVIRKQDKDAKKSCNDVKKIAAFPSCSKAKKTASTNGITSEKENIMPGLECEGRSLRSRSVKSFKEPNLALKLRR